MFGCFAQDRVLQLHRFMHSDSYLTVLTTAIFYLSPFQFWLLTRRQNAKTTERIDAKRSGITQNDTESVLLGLKSPVLVLSRRYREILWFSVAADHHDAKSRLQIFQCTQSLTFLQLYEHCKCNYGSDTHG